MQIRNTIHNDNGETRVIRLQDIRQKFNHIKRQVADRVNDPYLLKYIQTPNIDEDKILFLISIMDRLELSYSEIQTYTLSIMLIQIALDTHGEVSTSSDNDKIRQLTVLSGDYYSGLYYKLLADIEDLEMIRGLSKGVMEINEHKVKVYKTTFESTDHLIASIKVIESSLFARLAEYFKVDLWNDFLCHYLLMKRLLKEKNLFLQSRNSILFEALKKIIFPANEWGLKELPNEKQRYLLSICNHYIENSSQVIEKGIRQLPYLNEFLEKRITSVLSQCKPIEKTFVEEG